MIKPKFYDESKVGTVYNVDVVAVANEAKAVNVQASAKDVPGNRNALLNIDFQCSFCHPDGTLYVDGAEGDIKRTNEFIFKNFEKLTTITSSLDSHVAYQIFSPSWWVDINGDNVAPYTMITLQSIESGEYRPLIDPIGSINYVKKLTKQGNQALIIWPYHTLIGTVGQALDPALFEVLMFHALARKTQLSFLQKGSIPQTEMYGILSPEVQISTHPMGGFNIDFLKTLTNHDRVIIAGEAKSHCVLESIRQIYSYFKNDSATLNKIYILEDCMSSVKHPLVDFEAIAQTEFKKFASAGINIVKSTDDIL